MYGILLKSSRIVGPSAMKLQVLDKIHEGHQGIVKCRERAKKIAKFVPSSDSSELSHSCQHPFLNALGR